LGLFVGLAPLQELDRARRDNPAGMTFVAVMAAPSLVGLWLRVRGAGQGEVAAPAGVSRRRSLDGPSPRAGRRNAEAGPEREAVGMLAWRS
jgi:hypothetical protein